ncbi:hypothetical protein [Burkholderia cepacia]|uniref:hypothetical protein n=1 Tax=Burkholderia cepacia TaxID=292 RepID=UPI002AB6A7B8|nr:hypothetical protein [Burkholderia cepacia]
MKAPPSLNCFSGSIERVLRNLGLTITEHQILLSGRAPLLQFDESRSIPTYKFDVTAMGRLALENLNFRMRPIDMVDKNSESLKSLVANSVGGIICWLNPHNLTTSTKYGRNFDYMHAVVIEGVRNSELDFFDPLVLDIPSFSSKGIIDIEEMLRSITTPVKGEVFDSVNRFFCIEKTEIEPNNETSRLLTSVISEYATDSTYETSLSNYCESLLAHLESNIDLDSKLHIAQYAALTINTWFVRPMIRALNLAWTEVYDTGISPSFVTTDREWHKASMLLLKYRATADTSAVTRLRDILEECINRQKAMWETMIDRNQRCTL